MRLYRLSPLLTVAFLVCATIAWAQTGTGTIQGTIKDLTGAAMPRATVSITHTQTGREYNTTSNEVGFYLFPSVQTGQYEITVEAAGMEIWKGELTLKAGQIAEVDPMLKIAGVSDEVTVAGDVTPLVTTSNSTLANVVERARIEQLPVNGRFIQSLMYMTTPGFESGALPRLFGLRGAVEILQDGAVLQNRQWQSIPARPPGLDTIEEFRAETSNSSAKMNRPGTVILTTRAGTNEFHGAVFETHRNSAIGVARAREDFYDKPPHLVRNEFGASLGGPVFIPKLYSGNNKTFFFVSYEGFRNRTATTTAVSVPTAAMREGDFSGLIDAEGRPISLYDPLTTDATWNRQPFPNNQIPIDRRSPLATYLYSVTPLPTDPDVNPLVAPNWFGVGFNRQNQSTITTRIDHRLSGRDQIFFRYSHNPAYQFQTSALGDSPTTLDGRANARFNNGDNDSGVATWTHMFSPTFFSETLFAVQRDSRQILPAAPQNISGELGLPNPFGGIGFPRIQPTGFQMDYDSGTNPNIDFSRIYNVDQNFTLVKGRHELQFGGRWRYESLDVLPDQQEQQGRIQFSSRATQLYDPSSGSAYSNVPFTGHDAANLFLGHAVYSARFWRGFFRMRGGETAAYFQDNFKVSSRLTLNLGLRYEYNRPPTERDNSLIGFNPETKGIVMPRSIEDLTTLGHVHPTIVKAFADQGVTYETPSQAGLPNSLVFPNRWDFGPRAGFAWSIGPQAKPTVVRGGYSLFYFPEELRAATGDLRAIVPTTAVFANNPNSSEQSPDGLPNYLLRSVPRIITGVNSEDALDLDRVTGITPGTATVFFMDPHQPTARAHEWNLTVEREILDNTVLKLSYAGTHGSNLNQWHSLNEPTNPYIWHVTTGEPLPTGPLANVARRNLDREIFGTIREFKKTGWSNSNNFVAEIQHRYSKGYAFQMFYVLSNALRVAGDGWRDDILPATHEFLPGAVPDDVEARNRLLFYGRDIAIPKHRVVWNWIVDLPFGRGKLLGRNTSGFLNTLIGGWQIAGAGRLNSRHFALPTSMWGPVGNVEVYGKKYPIQDCRSGVCFDGFLYYNGYIPANRINSVDQNGNPNGVMGVPDSYTPFQTPINPTPRDGGSPSDPLFPFYETDTVFVRLKDGTNQRVTFDANLHPMQNQFLAGPMVWSMDASVFKSVPLKDGMFFRFSLDVFNVLNMPGTTMPDTTSGIISNQFSENPPRVMQLTGRLSW